MSEAPRVLVVDDELFVRELLLDFLGQNGFEVYLADRGTRAVELVRDRTYDLCLLDLKMPEMNGLEVMAEFEGLKRSPLVILMTGYPTVDSAVTCLRQGVFDYVIKPFKLPELLATVQKGLKEIGRRRREDDLSSRLTYLEAELSSYQAERRAAQAAARVPEGGGRVREGASARTTQQNNILALLERLGKLRSQGAVDEDEYRRKKDELLARL